MTTTVEFWFEFASTYTYPTAQRIETDARRADVRVRYRPFLLGPLFQRQGWNDSPFNLYPEKGRYMWRDLERICALHQLPWRRPSSFPRGSVLAARVALWAEDAPWLPAFVRAVFSANFRDDRDIGQRAVIAELLTQLGQDPERVVPAATGDDVKARLRAQTQAAQEAGIFGSPSFLVDGELFWGDDRLDQALAWATR